jgi:hypothetical protein
VFTGSVSTPQVLLLLAVVDKGHPPPAFLGEFPLAAASCAKASQLARRGHGLTGGGIGTDLRRDRNCLRAVDERDVSLSPLRTAAEVAAK